MNKILSIVGATAFFVCAVTIISCSSVPPTKVEQYLFNIQTNLAAKVVQSTNVITTTNFVTVTRTNEVTQPGGAVVTNVVTVAVPQVQVTTNVVTVTNLVPTYIYTTGQGAQTVKVIGAEAGGLFGVGGAVSSGLGALLAAWMWFRSSKKAASANNLAQTIETVREFIKTLPNGANYDTVLTNWMQKNQASAGVLNDVLSILQKEVSNPDAKVAAAQVQAALAALAVTPPKT